MGTFDEFFLAFGPAFAGMNTFVVESRTNNTAVFDLGVGGLGKMAGVQGVVEVPQQPPSLVAGVYGSGIVQPGVIGFSRENDGVEPLTARVPVGPEQPLVAKAGPVHEAQCRHILRCDEHLEAAKAERDKGPTRDQAHRFGRDTAATRRRNQTAPELAHPMLVQYHHHLTEVGVGVEVGDDEVEQTAVSPELLEILDDTRAVGRWQRRHRHHRRWILAELVGSVEVLDPERA